MIITKAANLTINVIARGDPTACQIEVQRLANLLGIRVDATCLPDRSVPVPLHAEPEIK